jgi:hypothetical protein
VPTDLLLASAAGGQLLIQKLQLHGILIGGIQIHHDVGLFPIVDLTITTFRTSYADAVTPPNASGASRTSE